MPVLIVIIIGAIGILLIMQRSIWAIRQYCIAQIV